MARRHGGSFAFDLHREVYLFFALSKLSRIAKNAGVGA